MPQMDDSVRMLSAGSQTQRPLLELCMRFQNACSYILTNDVQRFYSVGANGCAGLVY